MTKVAKVADNVTTFRGWLKGQSHRDDPIGDVARDVMADKGTRATTHRALRERIAEIGSPLAVEAIDAANREYTARLNGDQVPDVSGGLRDIGAWLSTLAGVVDKMPPTQRHALIRSTRCLRADLHAINIPVPEGWGK